MINNGYSEFADYWLLDRNIVFLNHGSFGSCPVPVLQEQEKFKQKLESEPLRFFLREFEEELLNSRNSLADFVGCKGEDLVFVQNATAGVNTVLKSLDLDSESEILFTDQIYPACRNTILFLNHTKGVGFKEVNISLPVSSPQDIIDSVLNAISEKTSIALIDHISSLPGMVFPVKKITEELHKRNISVLIDGAHAPGMLPLNITDINPDFYTGNCHKWLCTPKGSAFLYVNKSFQNNIHPLVTSRIDYSDGKYKSDFQLEFSWQGTYDPSAVLSIPFALEFLNKLFPGGINGLMKRNKELVFKSAFMICDEFKIEMPYPYNMTGSIYGFPFFSDVNFTPYRVNLRSPVQETLFNDFNIEVIVSYWKKPPERLLRISAQAYNSFEQYEYLLSSLKKILK